MSKATGNRLKKIAEDLYDGNQSDMARHMGMTPQAANKYFQGERDPGITILKRLVSIDINVNWVIAGIPPMKISEIKQADVGKIDLVAENGKDYFSDINQEDLSDAEARILAEVKQFSNFLRTRPLRPQVKRLLLELLIQSIDRALEQPQPGDDES